jgi:lon-related putative ATP-dependent protease
MARKRNGEARKLSTADLAWTCDSTKLDFETTGDLEPFEGLLGQDRAAAAMEVGVALHRPGYNLFAAGPQGLGKHQQVRRFIEEQAAGEAAPSDWCYVYNFEQPYAPNALELPKGRGRALKRGLEQLVSDLKDVLSTAFEGEDYRARRQLIEQELKDRQQEAFGEIEREAEKEGIALLRTPMGFTFAPVRDGKVIRPEVYKTLPQEERDRIEARSQELQEKLQLLLQQVPVWVREVREKLRKLDEETASYAVSGLIDRFADDYADLPEVVAHLSAMKTDLVDNAEAILQAPDGPRNSGSENPETPAIQRRYGVNLIVDNADEDHAPIVYESNPTYDRLVGRIEHRAEMGALVTDFHLIRAGALHRANGGYLVIDARRLLSRPMAYEGLKQALRSGQARIESLAHMLGVLTTVSLQPEPIELKTKVILIGQRIVYYLLSEYDPEFQELFKVLVDFDERIARDDDRLMDYVRLVAGLVRKDELRPFERGAVARLLEYSARMAGEAAKLSTEVETLSDVLREADFRAGKNGRSVVAEDDLRAALDGREYRVDRLRERVQEEIRKNTILVDTEGTEVGQVNGLSVLSLGGFAFGRPSRITARVMLGRGEVVDIEREVKLGGPTHSKGVLILSGFLGGRFAERQPLSLSASLVFEQSYGGVEGDSASMAELCALMSCIAGTPVRQDLAITGSMNQRGDSQAIGGVNEKIEGFFDLCAARGLTGEQGVIIPRANEQHLMLHVRVRDAVEQGKFHIYSVAHVDEAASLLTGLSAGEQDHEGAFPEGSLNARVAARLKELAERRRAFADHLVNDSGDRGTTDS